jgi:hypothetical protein
LQFNNGQWTAFPKLNSEAAFIVDSCQKFVRFDLPYKVNAQLVNDFLVDLILKKEHPFSRRFIIIEHGNLEKITISISKQIEGHVADILFYLVSGNYPEKFTLSETYTIKTVLSQEQQNRKNSIEKSIKELNNKATACLKAGTVEKLEQAKMLFETLFAFIDENNYSEAPVAATAYSNFSSCLRDLGKLKNDFDLVHQGVCYCRKALGIKQKYFLDASDEVASLLKKVDTLRDLELDFSSKATLVGYQF